MKGLDSPWFFALAASLFVGGLQMLIPGRWRQRVGRGILAASAVAVVFGVGGVLHRPVVVVAVSAGQLRDLGSPHSYRKPSYRWAYQGLFEKGFVIWVDDRFFELSLDRQYWHSFADPFPTNDPKWFTASSLRAYFPSCGSRLPIGGLAKAMLGEQKQYFAWLGCLQAENSSSQTDGVVAQRFDNGYVIEGVLDPPQSSHRKRFILLDDSAWESESIDDTGKYYPNALH